MQMGVAKDSNDRSMGVTPQVLATPVIDSLAVYIETNITGLVRLLVVSSKRSLIEA